MDYEKRKYGICEPKRYLRVQRKRQNDYLSNNFYVSQEKMFS